MKALPEGFILRAATNADGNAIRDLVENVLKEYGLVFDAAKTDAGLFDVEGYYRDGGGCFDVLLNECGRIVGTVGLLRFDDNECELVKMFLARESRGKGYGGALMDHAIREARRLGFKTMLLSTAKVLHEAVGLYETRGFVRFDWPDMPSRCDAAYRLNLQ